MEGISTTRKVRISATRKVRELHYSGEEDSHGGALYCFGAKPLFVKGELDFSSYALPLYP